MDKPKRFPFLSEESFRKQRVDVYLNDLKNRMKNLRELHDEVFQSSIDIIKEIDGVSTSLLSQPKSNHHNTLTPKIGGSRIKRLIQEFETARVGVPKEEPPKEECNIEVNIDIRKILKNFEELNQSRVLKDSLVLLKQAKESFDKIDTFLENVTRPDDKTTAGKNDANADDDDDDSGDGEVETKICYIRKVSQTNDTVDSIYGSCPSSVLSVANYRSTEEMTNFMQSSPSTTTSLENGYEGDNDDSEYDLLSTNK